MKGILISEPVLSLETSLAGTKSWWFTLRPPESQELRSRYKHESAHPKHQIRQLCVHDHFLHPLVQLLICRTVPKRMRLEVMINRFSVFLSKKLNVHWLLTKLIDAQPHWALVSPPKRKTKNYHLKWPTPGKFNAQTQRPRLTVCLGFWCTKKEIITDQKGQKFESPHVNSKKGR